MLNKTRAIGNLDKTMLELDFDWGCSSDWVKDTFSKEIFENKIYERIFHVEAGDVVVDVGASIGPFGYSINESIHHYYAIEPSKDFFPTLEKNVSRKDFPSTCINKAISSNSDKNDIEVWGNYPLNRSELMEVQTLTFDDFVNEHEIDEIDFLKLDCEGGEYDIFTPENFSWIYKNVRKIAGEWHLNTQQKKKKFSKFRNLYLVNFRGVKVFSVDGLDITDKIYSLDFIQYFQEIIIYIDNRKIKNNN